MQMRHFLISSLWLNNAKLLGMILLLAATAQVGLAQSTPSLSINDLAVRERDTGELFGHEFTVSLSAPSTQKVTVTVSTQPGTAISDVDFGAGSVTIDILPGKTSQTVTVFIKGDTAVEPPETFFVNLTSPINATIGDGQGLGTIIDDDSFLLVTKEGSQHGLAVDSVFHTLEPFAINTGDLPFFSTDHRMRISVFAVGLKLNAGETASAVTATAEDSGGTIRPLTVESVAPVPNNDWLTQVTMKLTDQITPAQDIKVKLTLHGVSTNTVLVAVKPQ